MSLRIIEEICIKTTLKITLNGMTHLILFYASCQATLREIGSGSIVLNERHVLINACPL